MKFSEVVAQTLAWLQREGRVSYRALKREFDLDDDFLEDLKGELIEIKELAIDKDGKMLVWTGATPVASAQTQASYPPPPVTYTPQHLAERIRAEQAALEARGVPDGERKTVAALFADLKGSTALIEGLDPGVTSASLATHSLWYLGYPGQALKRSLQAVTLAQELDHPHSLAFALSSAARSHRFRGEGEATQERAETLLTLATEQGFAQWGAQALIYLGWVLTEQGRTEEGVAQIRQGIAAHRATGAEVGHTYYLAWMAQALGEARQAEEGLKVLADALAMVDKNRERHYEAELYRLKGELTLQKQSSVRGPESEVPNTQHLTPSHQAEMRQETEECFLKAIDIARKQQAKSLELRATFSLARLWQQQGKQHEAHSMLSSIYNWFTEGFDTKDLQEAQALIEELKD